MMKEALFGGSQEAMRVLTVISLYYFKKKKRKKTDHGVRNDKSHRVILAISKKRSFDKHI